MLLLQKICSYLATGAHPPPLAVMAMVVHARPCILTKRAARRWTGYTLGPCSLDVHGAWREVKAKWLGGFSALTC